MLLKLCPPANVTVGVVTYPLPGRVIVTLLSDALSTELARAPVPPPPVIATVGGLV